MSDTPTTMSSISSNFGDVPCGEEHAIYTAVPLVDGDEAPEASDESAIENEEDEAKPEDKTTWKNERAVNGIVLFGLFSCFLITCACIGLSAKQQNNGTLEQSTHAVGTSTMESHDEFYGSVKKLTRDNFSSELSSRHTMVTFYAPWCSHCRVFGPTWEEFAHDEILDENGNDLDFGVAAIDCVDQRQLCRDQNINAYPSIFWYDRGEDKEPIPFYGERTVEHLESFARKQAAETAPLVNTLTEETFDDFLKKHPHVFVDFVWSQRLLPTWSKLTRRSQQEGFQVARVDCKAQENFCRKQSIEVFPTMRWFDHGKASKPDYTADRTVEALTEFAKLKLGRI